MNNPTIIEELAVAIIVVIQTVMAARTYGRISRLRRLLPAPGLLKVKEVSVPVEHLRAMDPATIIKNVQRYEKSSSLQEVPHAALAVNLNGGFDGPDEEDGWEELPRQKVIFVAPNEAFQPGFRDIIFSINTDLLKNKGTLTDPQLVKDTVERQLEIEEDAVAHCLPVPLYLGMAGTITGIGFGLYYVYSHFKSQQQIDISPLLGGVGVAMFSSFWGLSCTVVNGNFAFKSAKILLEKGKTRFYDFIHAQLFPVLYQNTHSGVAAMQQGLSRFNDDFSKNLQVLSKILNKNYEAIHAQDRILQTLDNIDIAEFAKANVKILKELNISTSHFQHFNQNLATMNSLSNGLAQLAGSFGEILSRTNYFSDLAEKLSGRVEESSQLLRFLHDHFHQLERRGEIINHAVVKVEDMVITSLNKFDGQLNDRLGIVSRSVVDMEDTMLKSLRQLEEHTQAKIEAIRKLAIAEEDHMARVFSENRMQISKLSLLEDLKTSLEGIRSEAGDRIDRLDAQVRLLRKNFEASNVILQEINEKTHHRKSLLRRIGNFFSRHKEEEVS